MPEQILHVSFTPSGQNPLIFEAARDVRVSNAVEITSEAGAATQVGPRLARRLSCQITCFDLDAESPQRPQSAVAQYRALEALVGQVVTVDARVMPAGIISWIIEAVNPGDSNESNNSFNIEVTAVQQVGGGSKASARLTRIQIPRLLLPQNPQPGAGEGANQPTGVYPGICQIRPTKSQKLNILVANGSEITGPLGQEIFVDAGTGEVYTAATRNPRKGQNMVFTVRQVGAGNTDTIIQWNGKVFVDKASGEVQLRDGREVNRFQSPKRGVDAPKSQGKVSTGTRLKTIAIAVGALLTGSAKALTTNQRGETPRGAQLPKC